MSIRLSDLIRDFEEALAMRCPYDSPGSTDWQKISGGVDCSGLFKAAFRRHGGTLPHGSNSIARGYVDDLRRIGTEGLKTGDVVFKWKAEGEPARFAGDGLGNWHHMGLVCGMAPLRIIHASSAAGCVTADSSAAAWHFRGTLRGVADDVNETDKEDDTMNENEQEQRTVTITAASLRVRSSGSLKAKVTGHLHRGDRVAVSEERDGWYRLSDGSGWINAQYTEQVSGTATGTDLAARVAELERRVAALEEAAG